VGSAYGVTGTIVTLPLSLQDGGALDIAEIVSRISFPPQLTFVRLDQGPSLESAEGVDWTVGDVKSEGLSPSTKRQVVEVRITRKRGVAPLRDGILGYLAFRIKSDVVATENPELPLTIDIEVSAHGGAAEAPLPAESYSEETKVLVEGAGVPSMFACFFYMH
jgi:hypothetical protein